MKVIIGSYKVDADVMYVNEIIDGPNPVKYDENVDYLEIAIDGSALKCKELKASIKAQNVILALTVTDDDGKLIADFSEYNKLILMKKIVDPIPKIILYFE